MLKNIFLPRNVIKNRFSTCLEYRQKVECDVAVIGGGIIGTAIARSMKMKQKDLNVVLLEKECTLAKHQSSHNSGVMHSGVYYRPDSLKAKYCVEGIDLLKKYCEHKRIEYKKCGKLIVAKDCAEISVLEELYERGVKNKVKKIEILSSPCDITKFASGCRGVKALWCPDTANVDFKEITQSFGQDFEDNGGQIMFNFSVKNILESDVCDFPILVTSDDSPTLHTKYLIACAGLQSESLTNLFDKQSLTNKNFISLKVDYHVIKSRYCDHIQTNIYPVPDLSLPFLGAHFSPKIDGDLLLGPSAVPALKTEGYSNNEINLPYITKLITSCGFRNMVIRNFSKCVNQTAKSICVDVQIKDLQELVPNFSYQYVEKGPTAVQCQILNNDGTFVDDFVFDIFRGSGIRSRIINVKFTPSPAATSCMAIANYVTEEFNKKVFQCQ